MAQSLCRCHALHRDAQAEEFLEHLSRAVIAELDGSLNNLQLLFGVNTVARAEFQRIQQELTHWNPLVEVNCLPACWHSWRLHENAKYLLLAAGVNGCIKAWHQAGRQNDHGVWCRI